MSVLSSKYLYDKVLLICHIEGVSYNKAVMIAQISLVAVLDLAILFYLADNSVDVESIAIGIAVILIFIFMEEVFGKLVHIKIHQSDPSLILSEDYLLIGTKS